MSYYGAAETLKAAILAVGLGLHYEDDPNVGNLADSVASDLDGTVLISNTSSSELYLKQSDFRFLDRNYSKKIVTVQVATDVGFERFQTDRLCELRGEAVLYAILNAATNPGTFDDLQSMVLMKPPTITNVSASTVVVWEANFLMDYRLAPTPIVYFDQESVANGATADVNTGQSWLTKALTIAGGGTVSNTSPLSDTQSINLDGVNDYAYILADHGDPLDFKIAEPWSFVCDYQYKGSGNLGFFLSRYRTVSSTISDFYFAPSSATRVRLQFHDVIGTQYQYEWDLAGTLADTVKRSFCIRYDGSKNGTGWNCFEDGVKLTLATQVPAGVGPISNEILAGTETSAETEWKIGAAIATGYGNNRYDRIGFFGETITDAQILSIANGTAPNQLLAA